MHGLAVRLLPVLHYNGVILSNIRHLKLCAYVALLF